MDIGNTLLKAAGKTLFRRTSKMPHPGRILVLRSSRFGDFVNAMPALYVLRKTFKDARIVLFTLPSGSLDYAAKTTDTGYLKLLDEGVVDETVEFTLPEILGVGGMMRLRRKVRELDCDMAFVLPFSGESRRSVLKKLAFLRALGVTKNVYGWKAAGDRRDIGKEGQPHQIFGPLGALKEAGIGFDVERDVVFPVRRDQAASEYVSSIWRRCGLMDKEVVAVFPGGTYEHKRWPLGRFSGVMNGLLKRRGVGVVLLGGRKERFQCEWLARSVPGRAYNLAGRLDHLSLAEALRRCGLFIGNDSGPGHLASAVGTPCITIFSSILRPGIWEPWNSRGLAVRESVDCEHCRSERSCPAGTNECINRISVERVLGMAEWELAKAGGRGIWTSSVR